MVAAVLSTIYPHKPLSCDQTFLAEKKVAGDSLNEMEALVDAIWSKNPNYRIYNQALSKRVHRLPDQTVVIDTTQVGGISVCPHKIQPFIFWKFAQLRYFVQQDDKHHLVPFMFSKKSGTEYVVISDVGGSKEISVTEKKVSDSALHVVHFNSLLIARLKAKSDGMHAAQPLTLCKVSPQHLATIAKFPVDDSILSVEDCDLLNKKVCGLLTRDEERYHLSFLGQSSAYCQLFNEKKSRIHLFTDEHVQLLDSTKYGIVNIVYDEKMKDEFITLQGVKVYFKPSKCSVTVSRFQRAFFPHLDSVVVRELEGHADWIVIERFEWDVNPDEIRVAKRRYVNTADSLEVELKYPGITSKEVCYEALRHPPK